MSMFVAPELEPANEAMAAGRYAEAGPLYERSAYACHREKDLIGVKMCSHLAIKAYAHAGDPNNAYRMATSVVDLFKQIAHESDIRSFATKALEALRTQGHYAAADAFSAHVTALVPTWSDPNAPKLPAFCSSCGAAVKPAEVARPTPSTVACNYCGASLARG